MSNTDIVIYERDSVDVTFTLDSSNEIITSFLATDTILLAIKNDTEGHAIILKDKTGVTGATVTFSLTKQDTARLYPQKYYYDIAVLKGDTQQTTVLKAGKFIVAGRGVKTNEKAELTLDKLTQYNLIASGIQANATSAQQSATSASNSATSASNTLSSVQALASSTSTQINQAVSTVTSAKETVQGALGNIESASTQAVSAINSSKNSAIAAINQAGAEAKVDSELVKQYAQQANASATSASASAETATFAKVTAKESSDAAHRYANQILAVSEEITEKANDLLEVVEEAKSDVESIRAETENLTAAASATQANVTAAQQAQTNAQSYAQQASASATSASNSADTATAKANLASASATSAQTSESNASTYASNASTSATNANTSAEQAQIYASNASASATQASNSASEASTYADNASASATSASSNAESIANQVTLAQGYANSASQSATDAQNSAESVQSVANQVSTNASNISALQTGKQDVISDIATIRSNASTGAGLESQVSTNTSNISSLTSSVNANTSNIALKANRADLATVAFTGDYANLINKPNISSSGGGNAYELLKQDFVASNWSLLESGMYQYGASHADIVDVYKLDDDGTYHKMIVAIHKPETGSATLYCTVAFDGYYTYGTNLTAVTDSEGNNILTTYATKTELANKLDKSGGTVTGNLINRNVATDVLTITGGTGNDSTPNGAKLVLAGASRSSAAGNFWLQANDGTNKAELSGYPNGTLNWNGKGVLTSAGGTLTGALIGGNGKGALKVGEGSYAELMSLTSSGGIASYVVCYSPTDASNPGRVILKANDGTNYKFLTLYPNGSLIWNSSNVITDSGTTYTGTVSVANFNIQRDTNSLGYYKISNYDYTSTPSELVTGGFYVRDKNSKNVGYLRHRYNTSALSYVQMGVIGNGSTHTELGVEVSVAKNATTGKFAPTTTKVCTLGASDKLWTTVYANTSTISTSDERAKSNIRTYTDEELDAWAEVEWCNYQMNDSIEEKGENKARIHNGLIAQKIRDVFARHNLDITRYAFFCYDKWEESTNEDGDIVPAGDAYALRYSECIAIESAYQRRRADRLEARLKAIEDRLASM